MARRKRDSKYRDTAGEATDDDHVAPLLANPACFLAANAGIRVAIPGNVSCKGVRSKAGAPDLDQSGKLAVAMLELLS